MELLKASSRYSLATIQNCSDTVNAWMRLSYYNMCGTEKAMVLKTIYHRKSTKRPHHTNVVQNVEVYVCRKKFSSFVLIQTIYWIKELNWFPSVTTEINFCWPRLRNICQGMVFNYLSQFLYKDTETKWYNLCCSFLLRICGRSLLTISVINWVSWIAQKSVNTKPFNDVLDKKK